MRPGSSNDSCSCKRNQVIVLQLVTAASVRKDGECNWEEVTQTGDGRLMAHGLKCVANNQWRSPHLVHAAGRFSPVFAANDKVNNEPI